MAKHKEREQSQSKPEAYYRMKHPTGRYGHLWVVERVTVRDGIASEPEQVSEPDLYPNAEGRCLSLMSEAAQWK